ncbi:hypothetical protein [Ruegeria faecimaris]|uniref:hypothetical protein n=1 Tax=Ruegeria faecimaris TaxID=686389 RepID=UPI00249112BC|nr:hypothetical protein [Ruegeria faecimaris]
MLPFLWMVGIIVAGNFLQYLAIRFFGSVFAWALPIVGLALLPGLWASFSIFSNKMNQMKEAQRQKDMGKKLIDEYAKQKSK